MILAADLFAGAGGGTTALLQAADLLGLDAHVVAVNHWKTAVDTHAKNHPGHVHYCDPVEDLSPLQCVSSGKLDLLIAGPSCVHFSRARGGAPKSDQQRSGAWQVFKWAQELNPEAVLVENVPDFLSWGPLDAAGRPIKGGLGAEFLRWVGALEKLGYRVEWRILCAADFGDPTTRKRLFIQATRGRVKWPMPSHCDPKILASFPGRKPWRAAREIIDFSIPSQSIFGRKKPLAEATLERILAGIRKFWGEAFLVGVGGPRSLHKPIALTEPMRSLLGQNHLALVEPFLVPNFGEREGQTPRTHRIDAPLPVVTSHGAGALVQPFLVKYHGGEGGKDRTLPTSTPLGTLDTSNRFGLIEPFLVSYYGNGSAHSLEEPLPTATGHDRFGLVESGTGADAIDIHLRMLTPEELQKAHSFPVDYQFCGTRGDKVKQIGNSWPVGMGTALCRSILEVIE